MLTVPISQGFALAHQRVHLVILDLVWKAIWLTATGALFATAGFWLFTELPGPDLAGANPIMLALTLRAVWNAYSNVAFWTFGGVLVLALLFRVVLEAYFRGGAQQFWVFAGSRLARTGILAAVASLLSIFVLSDRSLGIICLAAIVLVGTWFLLTVAETLIRKDAVEMFGVDPLMTAAAIGFFLAGELLSAALIAALSALAILVSSGFWEFFGAMTFAALAAIGWSVLQSYLFVVRCSTVDIMRRNVAGI